MSALTQFFGGSGGGSGIPVRGLVVTGGWGGSCEIFHCRTSPTCINSACPVLQGGIIGLRGGAGGRALSFKQFVSPGVTVPITVGYAGTSRNETYNFSSLGFCCPSPAGSAVWDRNYIMYLGTEGGSSCFGACAYVKVDPPSIDYGIKQQCTIASTPPANGYQSTSVYNNITFALDGQVVRSDQYLRIGSESIGRNHFITSNQVRQTGVFDNPVLFDGTGAGGYVWTKVVQGLLREGSGYCWGQLQGTCRGGLFPNVNAGGCYGTSALINKCAPSPTTVCMGLAALRINGTVSDAAVTDFDIGKTVCLNARGYGADWRWNNSCANLKREGMISACAYRSGTPISGCDFPSGAQAYIPCPGEFTTSRTNAGLQTEILGTISSFGQAGTGLQGYGYDGNPSDLVLSIASGPTTQPTLSGSCCCNNLRTLTDANSPMHQCTGHGNGSPAFMPADVPCISPYRPISASTTADTGTVIIQYPTDYNAATVSSPNVCNCSPQTPGCYTYRFLAPGSITFP